MVVRWAVRSPWAGLAGERPEGASESPPPPEGRGAWGWGQLALTTLLALV